MNVKSIRREPTYLSTEVFKACWLLAKARSAQVDEQGLSMVTTADQMADEILRDAITEKYPTLLEHFKAVDKLEKAVIKEIGGKP